MVITSQLLYKSLFPNFSRDSYATYLGMLDNVSPSNLDVGHIVYCNETGLNYIYRGQNALDENVFDTLVSENTNVKTINNNSIFGTGNINIPNTTYKLTLNNNVKGTTDGIDLGTIWAPSSLGAANKVLKVNSTGNGLVWADDQNTTYSKASDSTLGLIRTNYLQTDKKYPVKVNSNGDAYVEVPWTDTNTDTNTTYKITLNGNNYGDSTNGTSLGTILSPTTLPEENKKSLAVATYNGQITSWLYIYKASITQEIEILNMNSNRTYTCQVGKYYIIKDNNSNILTGTNNILKLPEIVDRDHPQLISFKVNLYDTASLQITKYSNNVTIKTFDNYTIESGCETEISCLGTLNNGTSEWVLAASKIVTPT